MENKLDFKQSFCVIESYVNDACSHVDDLWDNSLDQQTREITASVVHLLDELRFRMFNFHHFSKLFDDDIKPNSK